MKQKKVLLVDDVRLFLEMAKSFLSRENLQLTVAADGAEALKVIRAVRPDLVVMDLHMPGVDGAKACSKIKSDPLLGNVPVVLLAGTSAADRERCRSAGCDEVLSKPFRRGDLLGVVRRFLQIVDRATPRIEARMLVRYGVDREQLLHDYSLNLSVGGLFLETAELLPVAAPLSLEFLIPGAEKPLRCLGEVAWVNPAASPVKNDLPPGLGVRFRRLRPEDEDQLREFLGRECARRSG